MNEKSRKNEGGGGGGTYTTTYISLANCRSKVMLRYYTRTLWLDIKKILFEFS